MPDKSQRPILAEPPAGGVYARAKHGHVLHLVLGPINGDPRAEALCGFAPRKRSRCYWSAWWKYRPKTGWWGFCHRCQEKAAKLVGEEGFRWE